MSPGYLLSLGGIAGHEPIASYVIAILIFILAMRFIKDNHTNGPTKYLGNISYSLYLLHLPIGMTVLNLLGLLHVIPSLATLIAIAVSLAVSWVSYKRIELPAQALARELTKKG